MRDSVEQGIWAALTRAVAEHTFSVAGAAWSRAGSPSTSGAVTTDAGITIFDLASLTKLFTAAACLRLVCRGEIALDAPISRYLAGAPADTIGAITIEQLLRHRGGLAAWYPFFEAIPLNNRGKETTKLDIIARIITHPLTSAPGEQTRYSDLGYIILAHLLERITEKPLPEIIHREVSVPLGLTSIHFRPIGSDSPTSPRYIAPTQTCPWRGRTLVGEVHDDNAWAMGGIAGHAGLFGSAPDIAEFGKAWLEAIDTGFWLPKSLAAMATSPHPSGRGLGWDFKTPGASSAGTTFSETSFGHLGFTGCSLWVDPKRRLSAALLTNRVFYGSENKQIRRFRPLFHDLLVELMEGKTTHRV